MNILSERNVEMCLQLGYMQEKKIFISDSDVFQKTYFTLQLPKRHLVDKKSTFHHVFPEYKT